LTVSAAHGAGTDAISIRVLRLDLGMFDIIMRIGVKAIVGTKGV
tara:strand:- start:61 stop:192 length:132 start_codon:yes stop_codon:yes gene_type:complete